MPFTMVEIEEIEFLLGRDKFTVPALGSKQSKIWRKLVKGQVGDFVKFAQGQTSLLETAGLDSIMGDDEADDEAGGSSKFSFERLADINISDILPVLMAAFEKVNDIYDMAPDLVAAYSDQISDKAVGVASTQQLTYALTQMIRVEFASPFQVIMSRNGPSEPSTSKSLPSPNGESAPQSLPASENTPSTG